MKNLLKKEWEVDGHNIFMDGSLIITVWFTKEIDEQRLDGESWLDMRDRTEKDRIRITETEPNKIAEFIIKAIKKATE